MSGPIISDHALIRFLERCGGMDVEAVRAGLSQSLERAHNAARQMGQKDYLITIDGSTYVVRGDLVTTVLPARSPQQQFNALDSSRG